MDLSKKTLTEKQALAYGLIKQLQQVERNLVVVEGEIRKDLQEMATNEEKKKTDSLEKK